MAGAAYDGVAAQDADLDAVVGPEGTVAPNAVTVITITTTDKGSVIVQVDEGRSYGS